MSSASASATARTLDDPGDSTPNTKATRGSGRGSPSHETDVVVIGSGVGGLSAAAVLARHGNRVTVLESHYLPGGVAHAFDIQGYRFDAGPSLWAGMSESGTNPLRQVLDILDEPVSAPKGCLGSNCLSLLLSVSKGRFSSLYVRSIRGEHTKKNRANERRVRTRDFVLGRAAAGYVEACVVDGAGWTERRLQVDRMGHGVRWSNCR